jgi:hypothetical protein
VAAKLRVRLGVMVAALLSVCYHNDHDDTCPGKNRTHDLAFPALPPAAADTLAGMLRSRGCATCSGRWDTRRSTAAGKPSCFFFWAW